MTSTVPVNPWPLMPCVKTESRRSDFVKCKASFTVRQLPKSLTATNWPIFRISASIYVISIVVLFDGKKLTWTLQQLNHFDSPLRILKIAFPKCKISKFPSRGACTQTPLATPASGGRLYLGDIFLSNSLPLHSAGSCVLEFLSVKRTFAVPKDGVCKLIFFGES